MKKLFVINPMAGKGTDALGLAAEIERVSEEKVIEAVKNKVAVENKSVTIEEFNKLFEK